MLGYDVIGDVHGCGETLETLLRHLGYREHLGAWRHAGRQAIFVGDLIDRGGRQVETVRLVRRMLDAGTAQVVMGNHEFNAISFFTPDPRRPGEFLRSHNHDHRHQHREFLEQIEEHSPLHRELVEWFRTLPLWLDLGGLRVVHACWHAPSFETLIGAGPVMSDEFLVAANTRGTAEHEAVEVVLKGPEVPVPTAYLDKEGKQRHRARIRWWDHDARTWRAIAEIPPNSVTANGDPYPQLSDEPSTVAEEYRYHEATPVLFGHYWWRKEDAEEINTMATCVDYSVAKNGVLRAYRWDGEEQLDETKFVDC